MFIAATNDKYELPVYVADTKLELAKMINKKKYRSIKRSILALFRKKGKTVYGYKIFEVKE